MVTFSFFVYLRKKTVIVATFLTWLHYAYIWLNSLLYQYAKISPLHINQLFIFHRFST